MLKVDNVSKFYGANLILKNINFSINCGDKIAVVGLNGAGKTTLLNIILGNIESDGGKIVLSKNETLGWMPQTLQDSYFSNDMNVSDFISSARPIAKIEAELSILYEKLSHSKEKNQLMQKIIFYEDYLQTFSPYTAEAEMMKILKGLQISPSLLNDSIGLLSGGQKSKVFFARVLYSNPSFLILDEPTNHIDSSTKDWIVDYIKNLDKGVIFVSHDEDFLKKTANKVLYIDSMTHEARLFSGGYEDFLMQKEEWDLALAKKNKNQQMQIDKIERFIDSMQGVSGKRKRQAQSKEKLLEKLKKEQVIPPKKKKEILIHLAPKKEETGSPISISNISFGYSLQRMLIQNATFSLLPNERFLVVGENGIGKSTLLKILAGKLKPNSGGIRYGEKTDIGYYAQEHEDLLENNTVLDEVGRVSTISETKKRSFLARFNFIKDAVFQKISSLSPGERSRLSLAKLCLAGSNLLLLDEPTNHLDIPTKKNIADALNNYGGTMIVVSHDTDFLDDLGIERMLVLPECNVKPYNQKVIARYSMKIQHKFIRNKSKEKGNI